MPLRNRAQPPPAGAESTASASKADSDSPKADPPAKRTFPIKTALKFVAVAACAGAMYYVSRPLSSTTLKPKESVASAVVDPNVETILKANERAFLIRPDIFNGTAAGKKNAKDTTGADILPALAPPVLSYHLNQIASNSPIEDYHSEHKFQKRIILGVFDGHAGTECANVLSQYLGHYVAKAVSELPPLANGDAISDRKQLVATALKTAFKRMDDDIINGAIDVDPTSQNNDLSSALRPAIAGSCAIVAYIEGPHVYTACTGDSRAIIGRRRGDGTFEALALSEDQTTANPREYARLLEEHPGEDNTVVARGRVLGGLMPTRAFGDSRYKWDREDQELLQLRLPRALYKTPPYVTAIPEVTHYEINPRVDKFLILATDGIWDRLTNEQCADLVGGYMQRHQMVPDEPTVGQSLKEIAGTNMGSRWSWEDDNAATHLIRNALGQGVPERISSLLSLQAPVSRRYRDDMTANIVFFGESTPNSSVSFKDSTPKGAVDSQPFQDVDLRKADVKPRRLRTWLELLQKLRSQEEPARISKL
ncbi:hypothetical protein HDU85_000522 [Gaertneriomyces sp. JEL0708]|nr:hypothetical protein HDU85_000522 [Gaertneriomyces sp. JEL0708]